MGIRITSTSGGGSFKVKNQGSGGTFKATGNTGTSGVSDWVRPSDWLEMPAIGTQEFIGLLAITDDEANHIALTCAGNYTVDWGDGVIENVATGVKANHSYTYSSISSLTISSRGYKQVLVRVTPQAGQNLTRVDLQQPNSIIVKSYGTGWLDISVNGSNITTLAIGGTTVRNSMCERVIIGSIGVITNFSSFFSTCHSLQSVSLFNTSAGTNFSGMFGNCHSLQSVPLFNTSAGTNFSSMFLSCFSLKEVPLFNTAVGTNFNSMFQSCASLKTIPLINTALGTTFSNMFTGCLSLQTVPLLNLSSAITLTNMFVQCYSLQTIPLFNTVSATAFNGMFSTCVSLQSVPLLNTASGSNFANMFTDCSSLQLLPNFNTAAGTNFGAIFNIASLAKGAFQGTRYSIGYANMCLSRNAVIDIFNGLGTAVGTPTITITTNPAFSATPLNVSPGTAWRGVTIQSSSQDVYASNQSTGLVYKQTGGVGPFVTESLASSAFYRGVGTDIYGNIYLANSGTSTGLLRKSSGSSSWTTISTPGITVATLVVAGDYLGNLYVGTYGGASSGLLKQTALTGSFVQVFTGLVFSLAISPVDNSIYVTDGSATGTIYKQTGGSGSFDAVQNIPYVGGLCCMPNGDVYATNGTLYKQTAGTGSFVSMGILVAGTYGMINKPDGNLYAVSGDVSYLDFNKVVTPTDRLIATNKGWTIA